MKLKTVEVKNFRNFLGKHTFDFSRKITILLGDNGNGKSSLFDAIRWCLLDKFDYDTEDNIRDVIFNRESDGDLECYVKVTLDEGIIIERHIGKSGRISTYLYKDIADRRAINKSEYLNKLSDFLLGSNIEKATLENSVAASFLSQNQVLDFILKDKPKDRYDSLSSILGLKKVTTLKLNYVTISNILGLELEKINDTLERIKEDIYLIKGEIIKYKKNLELNEQDNYFEKVDISVLTHDLEMAMRAQNDIELDLRKLDNFYKKIKKHTSDKLDVITDVSTGNKFLSDVRKKINNSKIEIENLKFQVRELELNIEDAKQENKFLEKNKSNKDRILNLKAELNKEFNSFYSKPDYKNRNELLSLSDDLKKLEYTVDNSKRYKVCISEKKEAEKRIIEHESTIIELEEQKNILQNKLLGIQEEIINEKNRNISELLELVQKNIDVISSTHNYESTCPSCEQPLNKAGSYFLEKKNRLIEVSKKENEKLVTTLNRKEKLSDEINKIKQGIYDLKQNINKLQDKIQNKNTEIARISNHVNFIDNNFKLSVENIENRISTIKEKIEELNKYFSLKNELQSLLVDLKNTKEINIKEHNLVALDKECDSLKNSLSEKEKELSEYEILGKEAEYILQNLQELGKHKKYVVKKYGIDESSIENRLAENLNIKKVLVEDLKNKISNYQEFQELCKKKEELQYLSQKLTEVKETQRKYEIKNEIITSEIANINKNYSFEKLLDKNSSVIHRYFNFLNPNVSVYRELIFDISDEKSTLNIMIDNNTSQVKAVNILSSGQLNVLALAIFIAKNIVQKDRYVGFIAIDDPIQNMDNVNRFSMVDVLSEIEKQLIFTSHDAEYVNLFLKKNNHRLNEITLYYLDAEENKYDKITLN